MSELFGDSVYQSGDAVDDTDDLDPADNLTGDDPDEDQQTGFNPPDREPKSLRDGLTEREELEGESLDERLSEEEPEVGADGDDYSDVDPRAGRLVAPDEGAHGDDEADEIATDVGPAGYGSSAEEAAMHIVGEDRLDGKDDLV